VIYGCVKCADNTFCKSSNDATSVADVTGTKANPVFLGCMSGYF